MLFGTEFWRECLDEVGKIDGFWRDRKDGWILMRKDGWILLRQEGGRRAPGVCVFGDFVG